MQVIVIANIEARKEFESKAIPEGIEVHFEISVPGNESKGDVYFYLLSEDELLKDITALAAFEKPVFVNAVVTTLNNLATNVIRINAWPGFLERSIIEISAIKSNEIYVSSTMRTLEWKCQLVPDIPGMITARTIAMIVNEAYFALGDEVSTKEEIDTAMKLGTNYPYGPFEWAEKIGLNNIVHLLSKLSETEPRYTPAPLLLKEITK